MKKFSILLNGQFTVYQVMLLDCFINEKVMCEKLHSHEGVLRVNTDLQKFDIEEIDCNFQFFVRKDSKFVYKSEQMTFTKVNLISVVGQLQNLKI